MKKLYRTGYSLFALPVCMPQGCWLFFLIQKIETGLSVSLRCVPREFELASMSVLPSVSHLLHVLHLWPLFLQIRGTDAAVSLSLASSPDHRQSGLAHGVVCRSDCKVSATGSSMSATEKCSTCTVSLSKQSFSQRFKGLLWCLKEKNHPSVVHSISSEGALTSEW